MPTVANLAVSVTARTGDFNRKMQESAGVVRSFGSAVLSVTRRLAGFGAIAGGVTVAGLAFATKRAFDLANATAMTARKVGLATKELIGLKFAAGLAGIDTAKLAKRLERIVPKLDTLQNTLRKMGVSAGAVASMVQVVEALGVSMNQIQSQAIQDAIAAVRRLWTVLKATSLELAVRLGPAVEFVAKELLHFVVMARIAVVELATRLEPFIRSASERLVQFATAGANAGTIMPRSFGLIAEAGAKLANALAFVEAAWHGLNAVVKLVASHMVLAIDKILDAMRHVLFLLPDAIRSIAAILPIPAKQVEDMLNTVADTQKKILDTHLKVTGLATSLATDATVAIDAMNDAWERFKSGAAGELFKTIFADIAERAAAIVADIIKLQNIGLTIPDIPEKAKKSARARTAEFQQVSLARMAVQGVGTPSRAQWVRDPQLVQTNFLLDKIRFALSLPLPGVN